VTDDYRALKKHISIISDHLGSFVWSLGSFFPKKWTAIIRLAFCRFSISMPRFYTTIEAASTYYYEFLQISFPAIAR